MVSLCCDFSMISGISRVCHVCTAWDQHQPQRLCSFVVDVLAVSVLALSFFIGSKVLKPPFFTTNIFSPLANELMVIAWPPLYGWCLARAIFRAITAPKGKDLSEWFNFWCWFRAFLSSRIWTPLAILFIWCLRLAIHHRSLGFAIFPRCRQPELFRSHSR